MIIVPGQSGKDLCDPQLGVTRRDILRVGGSGLLGLGLGSMLELQAVSARAARGEPRSGLGQGQEHHHGLSPGRAEPPRPLGPQGERPRQRPERLQADRDQGPRHPGHRDPAQAGADHRQVHVHPLDELHAQRPVQSHGRDLPDDDGLHDRQGQPVGSARAAQPEGLPQLRLAAHPPPAAERADAAVRDAAPAVAGEQRRRQGGHRRASWARRTTRTRSTPTATTWTWPRWTGSRSTTCSSGPRSSPCGSSAGPSSATPSTPGCSEIDEAVADFKLNEYYDRALSA